MRILVRHLRNNAVAYRSTAVRHGRHVVRRRDHPGRQYRHPAMQNGAVTSQKVRPHTLLALDFKQGQLQNTVATATAAGSGGSLPDGRYNRPSRTAGPLGRHRPRGTAGPTGTTGPAGPVGPQGPRATPDQQAQQAR